MAYDDRRGEELPDEDSWKNLIDMADDYSKEDKTILYNDIDFYEREEVQYHTAEEAARKLFGFDSFRPGQKKVIDNILLGNDVLAVMPTGAGKSVCYQIPAVLMSGIAIVISPLISLMQDQVKSLNEVGIPAAFLNSALTEDSFFRTISKAKEGAYKIIYVAPERLMTEQFLDLMSNIEISMVTVDEAHCISQWGQDFRPSYREIVDFIDCLKKRPVVSAFTATATQNVRADIINSLRLEKPFILTLGYDRPNLFFKVERVKNKDRYLLDYISEHEKESGIIYCATRKNVDRIYEFLKNNEIPVTKYHAGMHADERKRMQDDFVFDYSNIMVATNAFGMGIDKSNVRFVIHYNMPQSMENYYQEAGRAGRDGLESNCILLFSPQDVMIDKFLIEHRQAAGQKEEDVEVLKSRDMARLRSMEKYCFTTECLRNYILRYFGEMPEKACNNCGNCNQTFETLDMTSEAKKIINCVYEARGRFGRHIIVDTVMGAKTKRLEEIGAIHYRSYGTLAGAAKSLLLRLIEELVLEQYLIVGNYNVIEIGNIEKLKEAGTRVMVKITEDDKISDKSEKVKNNVKKTEMLTSDSYRVFEKLRKLRLEIAREEKMPPYIVFNDHTLKEMAIKLPATAEEMLSISGVGERKLMKYGDLFLAVITDCLKEKSGLSCSTEDEKNMLNIEAGMETQKSVKKSGRKQEFILQKEEAEKFCYKDYNFIGDIRDEMNRVCNTDNVKKISAKKLLDLLTDMGLIIEEKVNGVYCKRPTEKGADWKIDIVKRQSDRGSIYETLAYQYSVQKMLVNHFTIENSCDGESVQDEKDNSRLKTVQENSINCAHKYLGAYSAWTEEEEKKLVKEFQSSQFSIKDLSEIHGRTTGAIRAHLKRLCLIE